MAVGQQIRAHGPVASRIVAALFGGYALAALTSVAALALPMRGTEAVFTGMLLSFLVYAGAVVWVFAVRSARRAWAGLALAGLGLCAVWGLA
ncbi:DUF3649 domain-containing protein [Paenirhodobacter sp.]|uniref:DUF3649 domain-containing protein n=1 Tax=Paenirhodobacter sp. TaxID=1965326 RepID=UPI003B3CE2A3